MSGYTVLVTREEADKLCVNVFWAEEEDITEERAVYATGVAMEQEFGVKAEDCRIEAFVGVREIWLNGNRYSY